MTRLALQVAISFAGLVIAPWARAQCGNAACDLGETACGCPADCADVSGDGCCSFTGVPGGRTAIASRSTAPART